MNKPTNLFDVIPADRVGPAPIFIKAQVTPTNQGLCEGVPASSTRIEYYVCLSVLPEELRKRVELAIQALQAGF